MTGCTSGGYDQLETSPETIEQELRTPTDRLMENYSIDMCLCLFWHDVNHLERGSSVGRMPDSQSREPGFESLLLPFRSLGIFFHFTTPQSTQLYK